MKTQMMIAMTVSLIMSQGAFAASKAFLSCDLSEELTVVLKPATNGSLLLNATVTEDSLGGSFPQFHFAVSHINSPIGQMGAPMEFKGKNFDLQVKVDTAPKMVHGKMYHIANFSAANLGINNKAIYCTQD